MALCRTFSLLPGEPDVEHERVAACAAEPHFGMPASAAWNVIAGRAIAVRYAVSIRSNVSPPLRSKCGLANGLCSEYTTAGTPISHIAKWSLFAPMQLRFTC